MPLLEIQFQAQIQTEAGQNIAADPAVGLAQSGPCLKVALSIIQQQRDEMEKKELSIPESVLGLALIDTGAQRTAVDESVCKSLGLESTGIAKISHAGGSSERLCYPINIEFPGTPLPPIASPSALSVDLRAEGAPYILLFGRDLLIHLRMVYNGPKGRIEIQY